MWTGSHLVVLPVEYFLRLIPVIVAHVTSRKIVCNGRGSVLLQPWHFGRLKFGLLYGGEGKRPDWTVFYTLVFVYKASGSKLGRSHSWSWLLMPTYNVVGLRTAVGQFALVIKVFYWAGARNALESFIWHPGDCFGSFEVWVGGGHFHLVSQSLVLQNYVLEFGTFKNHVLQSFVLFLETNNLIGQFIITSFLPHLQHFFQKDNFFLQLIDHCIFLRVKFVPLYPSHDVARSVGKLERTYGLFNHVGRWANCCDERGLCPPWEGVLKQAR